MIEDHRWVRYNPKISYSSLTSPIEYRADNTNIFYSLVDVDMPVECIFNVKRKEAERKAIRAWRLFDAAKSSCCTLRDMSISARFCLISYC